MYDTVATVEDPEIDRIHSVTEMIDLLKSVDFSPVWFRGQGEQSWPLTPTVLRNEGLRKHEVNVLRRFKQETARLAPPGVLTLWEWVVWAQHYALPTRLLDWTTNPLVGLYFAASTKLDSDGRLFCLAPEGLNAKSRVNAAEVLLLDDTQDLEDYSPYNEPKTLKAPLAVISPRIFGRIHAQSGVFTITTKSDPNNFSVHAGESLISWIVPVQSKQLILNELAALRIERSTVYDDAESYAREISEYYYERA